MCFSNRISSRLHGEPRQTDWWAHIAYRSKCTSLYALFIPLINVYAINANSIRAEKLETRDRGKNRTRVDFEVKVELYPVWLNGQTELTWIISDYCGTFTEPKKISQLFIAYETARACDALNLAVQNIMTFLYLCQM